MIFLITLQVQVPEEGKVIYWVLGILVTALAAALGYVRTQHTEQITAKNEALKKQQETIAYERGEKEKAQQDYKDLVREFNSIFQHQNLISRKNG